MDKVAILENQISSLKEIVQIQEKQLNNHLNSPEEILTQWRNKVHELLVKNKFLLQQNKEFENNSTNFTREKEIETKKNLAQLGQKNREIEVLKTKLKDLSTEKEDAEENHKYILSQNKELKEKQYLLKFHFQDILESIQKQYQIDSSKVSDRIFPALENFEKKVNEFPKYFQRIKNAYSNKIRKTEEKHNNFRDSIVKVLQFSSENQETKSKQISEWNEPALIQEIQIICNDNRTLNQQLLDVKASKEDLQFKFQNNNLQNENLLNEIARLNQTLNQKENGISDMLKKISELETKFEGELQKNNNLNIELNKKIGEISQLTEEMRKHQRFIEELQTEKNNALVQHKETIQKFQSLEDQKKKEFADLKLSLQKLEQEKQEELRKMKFEHESKMLEIEKQKNDIIHSLRLDLESITEKNEKDASHIEMLENSLETSQSKIASLLNQVNDLLKIIELKDRDLKKYRNQQSLDMSQGARSQYLRGSTFSKANMYPLETPQTKNLKKKEVDENKSPSLSQGWGTLIKAGHQPFAGDNTMSKSQSKITSKIEAIEKMALNVLDDDDDF